MSVEKRNDSNTGDDTMTIPSTAVAILYGEQAARKEQIQMTHTTATQEINCTPGQAVFKHCKNSFVNQVVEVWRLTDTGNILTSGGVYRSNGTCPWGGDTWITSEEIDPETV
jgi:hypothetical protein